MAEGGGGKDLGGYGDRKRKEMLDRIAGRKRRGVVGGRKGRGVVGVEPDDMEVEGEVVPVSVPVVGEVQQPSASPSPTLDVTPDLPMSRIMKIADRVKKNVMKRLPGRALNRLQELPKFNDDLLELIYKRTQEEADAGSSTLDEFGPNTFNKESLEGYDVEEHYEKLCTTFPTAMTVAAALVTKKKDCAEGVKQPTARTAHGPRGAVADLRPVVTRTVSQLLHQRHPRQVTAMATLRSLHNAINMVPSREQARGNQMGDCYSKKESLKILKSACDNHDAPVRAMSDGVKSLYTGSMVGASSRYRKAVAVRQGIMDFSHFVDNCGRQVNARHNRGEANSNRYLHQTMKLVIEHRIPTAHLSDTATIKADELDFHLTPANQQRIRSWIGVAVGTSFVNHIPALASCKKYIKVPEIAYAERMASKSKCMVLDVSNDDPSTTRGCTSVLLDLLRYSSPASPCGEVRRKKVVFGDQALVALSRKCISSRSDEKAPEERLNSLIPQPQDFHAKMENLAIYRKHFDPGQQLYETGSISHLKSIFHHTQADREGKNYFANQALLEVTTHSNLIALLQAKTGIDYVNITHDAGLTKEQFDQLVESIVDAVDLLPWIWNGVEDDPTDDDQFLRFRRDMVYFGLKWMARGLAIQYGDGQSNNAFWLSDMYWYNRLGKWKYRIEAFEKWACVSGVHGKAAAITSTFCCFDNSKGCKNTNKPGDLTVEQANLKYKKRSDLLKGNYTEKSLSLVARSIDLAEIVDGKLDVHYDTGVEEGKARRNLKRKEKFSKQVKTAVNLMQRERTLEYVPGRKYVVQSKERVSYLREERVDGKPASLVNMERWLRARKVDLGDHVRDMEEKAALDVHLALPVDDDGEVDLEMGPEGGLGLSEDEEVHIDGNGSSDSE